MIIVIKINVSVIAIMRVQIMGFIWGIKEYGFIRSIRLYYNMV